jgi:hypothetical protein
MNGKGVNMIPEREIPRTPPELRDPTLITILRFTIAVKCNKKEGANKTNK